MGGLVLDPWQCDVLAGSLGMKRDGLNDDGSPRYTWAARRVGVIVSRQNGKGSILEARVLAGLLLFGERLIIWTAQLMNTALEAMSRVEELIEAHPELRKEVKSILRGNGKECIYFRNGSRLRFMARSKNNARGFTCDCLILDEAYALTDEQLGAILSTLSARPNPQIWFTSSPPLDSDSGEALFRLRDAALAGDPSVAYFDWGVQGHDLADLSKVDLADPNLWAQANPALGFRLTHTFTEDELNALSAVDFARERLGIWPARHSGASVLDPQKWVGLAVSADELPDRVGADLALAVDISPLRDQASIVAYWRTGDGVGYVELVDNRAGTDWIVGALRELAAKYDPVGIGLDEYGPGGSLLMELVRAGFAVPEASEQPHRGELAVAKTRDVTSACAQFVDAVNQGQIKHGNDAYFNRAVAGAKTRMVNDAFAWMRRTATSDITPLCAATLARWVFETRAHLVSDADYDLMASFY